MLDYETLTLEQYEAYFNDQYGSEDDYLMTTDTDNNWFTPCSHLQSHMHVKQ